MEESEVDLLKAPGRKGDKCPNLYFSLSSPTTRATMNNPPPPPNTWPLQPNQPFYIQTAFGPAIYNPSTSAWSPIFAAQHPQAAPFPPPAQPNLLTPAVDPPSVAASPSSPPRQPSTSAVPQSTYTPSDGMVDVLGCCSDSLSTFQGINSRLLSNLHCTLRFKKSPNPNHANRTITYHDNEDETMMI